MPQQEGGPRHADADRLHGARRHIDDEAWQLTLARRFQVLGNAVDVPVIDEAPPGLHRGERLTHEQGEVVSKTLLQFNESFAFLQ